MVDIDLWLYVLTFVLYAKEKSNVYKFYLAIVKKLKEKSFNSN